MAKPNSKLKHYHFEHLRGIHKAQKHITKTYQ